jgi:hypothetical protein
LGAIFRKQKLRVLGAVLLVGALGVSGCFLKRFRMVNRGLARITGPLGWYRVTPLLGVDARGNATLPPRDRTQTREDDVEDEDYDEEVPLLERLDGRFKRQLSPLLMDADTACAYLTGAGPGPVFILLHGVKGVGSEWWPVIPTLNRTSPSGMFMFRWNATQERAVILDALVKGINRIAACSGKATTVVLAHSAGGVIGSFAAGRFKIDSPQRLEVHTVSSPLSGIGYHSKIEDDDDDTRFFNDLGSSKEGYPTAAPNVWVQHHRTQYPGDQVMKPNAFGHSPNQRGVGVKGAREIDLPDSLTHDGALLYVANQLAARDWSTVR